MTDITNPTGAENSDVVSSDTVLVGHDGSAGAQAALIVALELADKLQAPVVLVRSWSITTAPQPANWKFGYVSSSDEVQQAVLDELVNSTQACRRRFPDVAVSHLALHGGPSQRLIELSKQARMLVVGSRGMGGFAELVMGSVSDQCVRYAHCPVLVVKNTQSA
jgi:nucleotide-binding universal stress UspA family protein